MNRRKRKHHLRSVTGLEYPVLVSRINNADFDLFWKEPGKNLVYKPVIISQNKDPMPWKRIHEWVRSRGPVA